MNSTFSVKSLGIVVEVNGDRVVKCIGRYDGISIRSAIIVEGGLRCVLLLDPDEKLQGEFANLICIDAVGNRVWTARLLPDDGTFVAASCAIEGIVANTWGGYNVLIDRCTGGELARQFVK